MEQPGHTPEIVADGDGKYWMACAGISSTMGRPCGFCDLLGTYIQPIAWRKASHEELEKITRV
jgi:hypothetical protein